MVWFIIYNVGATTLTVLVGYLMALSKKTAEYEALERNLGGVIKHQIAQENKMALETEWKRHLQTEARTIIFEMSDVCEAHWNAVYELARIADDDSSKPILRNYTETLHRYLLNRSKLFMLHDLNQDELGAEQKLINAIRQEASDVLELLKRHQICDRQVSTNEFSTFTDEVSQVYAKHDPIINKFLAEFRGVLKKRLELTTQ